MSQIFQSSEIMIDSSLSSPYKTCTIEDFRSGSIIALVKLSFDTHLLESKAREFTGTIEETLQTTFIQAFKQQLVEPVEAFVSNYDPDLLQVYVEYVNTSVPTYYLFPAVTIELASTYVPSPTVVVMVTEEYIGQTEHVHSNPFEVPVEPTEVPAVHTELPVSPTEEQVELTVIPVEDTKVPVSPLEVESTEVPHGTTLQG